MGRARSRSIEFLKFLEQVESRLALDFDVYLVLNKLKTHKTQLVHYWMVQHLRVHLHFIPTSVT